MNKVETKKHWYDKPLKFVFFLLILLPFGILLGNYISCQLQFDKAITIRTTPYQQTGTEEERYGFYGSDGGNINNPFEYNYDLELTTPMQNALWYTSLELSGANFTYSSQDGENVSYIFSNIFNLNDLKRTMIKIVFPDISNLDLWPNERNKLNEPAIFTFFLFFYEVETTLFFILLRIILFLPNVICYLLDWVERRLGKL